MNARLKRVTLPQMLIMLFLILYALVCVLPLIMVLSASFTSESILRSQGYALIPRGFTLDAYKLLYRQSPEVISSYGLTILVTAVGTFLAVLISACTGYALANKDVYYRNALSMFLFLPTLISAGIVPWYMVNNLLGLRNNILALIVPRLMFSVFNVFLVRNFMAALPEAMRESAKIDGANDVRIALQIYFPLSLPVLATITLFYGLNYWNDWYNAMLFLDEGSRNLYPLQYFLNNILTKAQAMNAAAARSGIPASDVPSEPMKLAMTVVATGPIILLYPFLQKYFVKGVTIGAVKG